MMRSGTLEDVLLPIYVHTNRSLPRMPKRARGYSLHTGWWPDDASRGSRGGKAARARTTEIARLRALYGHRAKPKWMVENSFKWPWMIEHALRSDHAATRTPVLLADSDVVVQCTASELFARWKSFNAPIVASAERLWAPRPARNEPNPFPPAASGMRYPNSGLLMGRVDSFIPLWQSIQRVDSFPCCAVNAPTSAAPASRLLKGDRGDRGSALGPCVVNDQSCLQAVLASEWYRHRLPSHPHQQRASSPTDNAGADRASTTSNPARPKRPVSERPSRARQPMPRIVLDHSASLFLSLFYLNPDDVAAGPDGRLVFTRTNTTPCVLHANGACKRCLLAKLKVPTHLTSTQAWALRWDECRLFRSMQPCALPDHG